MNSQKSRLIQANPGRNSGRNFWFAGYRATSLLVGAAAALAPCFALADSPATHPNIIYILTDDLGWGDLGVLFQNSRAAANNRSKPWHLTPNLDRFAAEGVQMPAHYCPAPVCAPSRASIMLGVSQGHANVRDNQFDKALESNHTLATVLKQAGYATVAIGKWGLQGANAGETNPVTWPAYPTKRGFDYFFGYARHADGHEHYPKEGPYQKSKQVWDGTNMITPELDKCYTADLWTARAKQWILDHESPDPAQPFFMYLAYDTPHATTELPTQAYPDGGGLHGGIQWLGTPGHMINTASGKIDSWMYPEYRDATWDNDHNPATPEVPWPDVYKRYATDVRRIDDAVGDLKQLLQDLKIDNDTLVIFTSDNGPSIESYLPNRPLRADFFDSFGIFDGIKRDCLEGGVRVPTLARWPGRIPPGRVITQPSIAYDWMRTFADVAGLPAPARADGASLLPELTGHGAQQDRGYLYVEYFNDGKTPEYVDFTPSNRGRLRNQMQAIRIGDYVGLRYDIKSHADPFEIYQVTVDPKEATNLAPRVDDVGRVPPPGGPGMAALEQQMKALVLQVRRPDSGAPRPYDNELVPASPVASVVKGVEWKAYEGVYPWVPDLETLPSVASGTADQPDLQKRTRENNIGLLFTGFLDVPQDGMYTFYLSADTGALLRIRDATVIDADFGYTAGKELSGAIRLQAGLHPFRLYYARRDTGKPELKFSWSGPNLAKDLIPASAFRRPANAK